MTTAILHIGQHKTGSSSIQLTLSLLDPATASSNFRYVKSPFRNHSMIISSAFGDIKNLSYYRKLKFGNGIPLRRMNRSEARKILRSEVKKAQDRDQKIVISAEDFCALEHSEVQEARVFFEECGVSNFKVFGYFRGVQRWSNSFSQQIIKQGNVTLENVLSSPPYPMYREYFEKFLNVFGAANVSLNPFDKNCLFEGCVVRDFLKRAEMVVSNEHFSVENTNDSLTAYQVQFASFMTQIYRENGWKHRGKISPFIKWIGQDHDRTKFFIKPSVISKAIELAEADVEWLVGVTGVDRNFLTEQRDRDCDISYNAHIRKTDLARLAMLANDA
ncbi:MAG: hypothetical protein ACRBCL_02590 [Maritimibacter sp.]